MTAGRNFAGARVRLRPNLSIGLVGASTIRIGRPGRSKSMKIDNEQESHNAAQVRHRGGEHKSGDACDGQLTSLIEEKLEEVKEEIAEIEELIHERDGRDDGDGHHHDHPEPKVYCIEIEGVEHTWSHPT